MRLLAYAAATGVDITAKNIGGLLGLTPDMAAAIHAYTQESKFYKKLNVLLRSRARAELKPFFPYLKLFMSAMHRLPPEKCTLYVMHCPGTRGHVHASVTLALNVVCVCVEGVPCAPPRSSSSPPPYFSSSSSSSSLSLSLYSLPLPLPPTHLSFLPLPSILYFRGRFCMQYFASKAFVSIPTTLDALLCITFKPT